MRQGTGKSGGRPHAMLGENRRTEGGGPADVPASQPESDRDQTLTLSDVQALAVGCEAACAHALGGCDGSHEHAAAQPQLATEPLEVSAAVEADPLFGAEQRTLPQDQWHAVLERLVGMMQQVADALGDMVRLCVGPFAASPDCNRRAGSVCRRERAVSVREGSAGGPEGRRRCGGGVYVRERRHHAAFEERALPGTAFALGVRRRA